MNASKPNFLKKPVEGKYTIQSKLKEGGFGSVFIAKDIKQSNRSYAIKLMPMSAKKYADIELSLYGLLQKHKVTTGFVKFYDNGVFMDHKYLLMELIGADLEDVKKKSQGEKMSVKTVLMIGLQMIDRLQAFHRIGYLHRDVKPDNIAIGLYEKSKIIYLFDFGLAHPIGAERPKQEKGKVVGTLGFMSCRCHEGKDQGPSDDIESLIYTLLYLAEGSLPWLKLQIRTPADFHKILLSKRGLNKKSFKNQKIPEELFDILQYVQRLKPTDKIDYLQLKFRLLQCLKKIGQENDFAFDWLTQTERKKEPLSPLKKKKQEQVIYDEKHENKKLEQMNQENQQLVQKQIYEVYKFMQKFQDKQTRDNKRNKSKSPPKKNDQKVEEQKAKDVKKRPVSAVNKPKRQVEKALQPWQKIMNFESSNTVSGPRIVINKTAKHKI